MQRYIGEHRRSPLIREIQAGCQIVSYKSAIDRLNALERKGYLKRAANKHRGIRLMRRQLELVPTVPEGSTDPAQAIGLPEETVAP